MTRPVPTTWPAPSVLGLCALAAAAILLGACGKKSNLSPPEGREAAYTHPRIYPAVPTRPSGAAPAPARRASEPRRDPLSPFPDSRTSPTKTYGKS